MSRFDMNDFKRQMKQWVRDNPVRNNEEFKYFCAMRIPDNHAWVIAESVAWYNNLRLKEART